MFNWLQRREPKDLIERRQFLSEAMVDYSVYQPPHRQGPNYIRRKSEQSEDEHIGLFRQFVARGNENFQYFMEQRNARLAALYGFLNKFGVNAGLDDAGLTAVSAWFPGNGCALVGNLRDKAVVQAFYQMNKPWTHALRGFNVVFDLGVFLGECLIARQPRLHWKYRSGLSNAGESATTGYSIEGFRRKSKGNHIDPPQYILTYCGNDLNDRLSGRSWRIVTANVLVGKVRDFSTR
jgi:hypothetical protein